MQNLNIDFLNFKYQLNLKVQFSKQTPDNIKTCDTWFNSGEMTMTAKNYIDKRTYDKLINEVTRKIEKFTQMGSGWVVSKLLEFRLKVVKVIPIKDSSYIQLPEKYRNPHYKIVNIKNEDQECFKWCVARYFCRKVRNPQRITKQLKSEAEKLNWKNIQFPLKLDQIH